MPAISRSTLYFTRVLNRSEFCDHRTIVPFHVFKQLDMKQFARYCPHMLTPAHRRRSTERTSKCVIVIGFGKCNANFENSEKKKCFCISFINGHMFSFKRTQWCVSSPFKFHFTVTFVFWQLKCHLKFTLLLTRSI